MVLPYKVKGQETLGTGIQSSRHVLPSLLYWENFVSEEGRSSVHLLNLLGSTFSSLQLSPEVWSYFPTF